MAGAVKRHSSISIRLPLLLISSFLIIIAFVVALVYMRFEKRTIQEYTIKVDELNNASDEDKANLAIVMTDFNDLKRINDENGTMNTKAQITLMPLEESDREQFINTKTSAQQDHTIKTTTTFQK